MSNIIDKKLFEQIFGHTLETLVNKVINTKKNKKKTELIVNNINKNKEKLNEQDKTSDFNSSY